MDRNTGKDVPEGISVDLLAQQRHQEKCQKRCGERATGNVATFSTLMLKWFDKFPVFWLDMSCPQGAMRNFVPSPAYVEAVGILRPSPVSGGAIVQPMVHEPYNIHRFYHSWVPTPGENMLSCQWNKPEWHDVVLGRIDVDIMKHPEKYISQYLWTLKKNGVLVVPVDDRWRAIPGCTLLDEVVVSLPCGKKRLWCYRKT